MTDKEFEDAINNPQKEEKVKFGGTAGRVGNPGKQSFTQVWSSNKDAIVPGAFGKQLAQEQFNTKINEGGLLSKEEIRRIIDKENKENGE